MKELKKYAPIISLVLVVVAVVMLFLEPSMVYKVSGFGQNASSEIKVPGYKVIFGIDDNFDFNVLGFAAVLLLALGAVLPLLKDSKELSLVAGLLLVAGGVLMFVFPSTIDILVGKYSVAGPLIIAAVLGILAGLLNLLKLAK